MIVCFNTYSLNTLKAIYMFPQHTVVGRLSKNICIWCDYIVICLHCPTNGKVAGSNPDGVSGIFLWHNPSGRPVALGSTQPLTEISTRNISWGVKAAGAWGRQPYHLHMPIVLKSGSLNLLEPSGPVQACNGIALPLHTRMYMHVILFLVSW